MATKKSTGPVGSRLSHVYVPGIGPSPCRVMLVGEGPGRQEDRYREPFVGPAGQLLTDILDRQGLTRDTLYITNIVKRRVQDDDDPTEEEVALFRPDLLAELDRVQPEVVIAAGGFATRFFLGPDASLELLHGLPQVSAEFGVAVIPCYHPASALHDTDNMPSVYWDYAQAARYINGEIGLHEPVKVRTKVLSMDTAPATLPHGTHLGIDTEDLVDGSPWCATLSIANGEAYFLRADDATGLAIFQSWIRHARALTIYIHHTMHDLKPLRWLGVDLKPGLKWGHTKYRVVDTMVLAYEQGRLHTQALKTLVYRRLGKVMDHYMDIVGPVAQRRAWWDLVELSAYNWGPAEETATWDEETGKVKFSKPWTLNRRIDSIMGDHNPTYKGLVEARKLLAKEEAKKKPKPEKLALLRGEIEGLINEGEAYAYVANPQVDLIERWSNIDPAALEPIRQQRGGGNEWNYGPEHTTAIGVTDLSHCDPTLAIHYACSDAAMTRELGMDLEREHADLNLGDIARIDHGQIAMVESMTQNGLPAHKGYFISLGAEMKQMQAEVAEILSAVIGRPINPNSSDQVAQLLYVEMGLDPVKMTRSGKASTGKKALQHLRKTNMLVDYIMESREYGKIDDAFCRNIARRTHEVDHHGTIEERAFYELQVTRVKTGRLAAKNFNALAIPTRTELGRRIRYGFKAGAGRKLGTWDLNQIEMRVMAHMSRDPKMIEIYNRDPKKWPKWDRDLHIYTVAEIYDYRTDDIYHNHKGLRTACKSTGFGILMGITGVGLSDQMRLYGLNPDDWPEDRCEELKKQWLTVFRGVDDFQMDCKSQVRRTGEIRGMFGRRFQLPHVHCPLSWIREEGLRQSHALPIQDSAQCIEKMGMADLYYNVLPAIRKETGCYVEPLLQVHDEIIMEFDEEVEELLDAMMLDTLTSQVQMLVPVEAGGATGSSWGDLEK